MQTSYWNNLVDLVRNYGPSQPYYLSFKIRLQLTESSCNNSRTSTWLKICGVSSKAARLTPGLGYSQSWCSMWSPPTSTRCSEHSPTSHSCLWIFQSPGYLCTYLWNQDWVHAVVPRRSGSLKQGLESKWVPWHLWLGLSTCCCTTQEWQSRRRPTTQTSFCWWSVSAKQMVQDTLVFCVAESFLWYRRGAESFFCTSNLLADAL